MADGKRAYQFESFKARFDRIAPAKAPAHFKIQNFQNAWIFIFK